MLDKNVNIFKFPFSDRHLRILTVLQDGKRHSAKEIMEECEIKSMAVLANNFTQIRKLIRVVNEDILCEFYQRRIYYRHIKLIVGRHDV